MRHAEHEAPQPQAILRHDSDGEPFEFIASKKTLTTQGIKNIVRLQINHGKDHERHPRDIAIIGHEAWMFIPNNAIPQMQEQLNDDAQRKEFFDHIDFVCEQNAHLVIRTANPAPTYPITEVTVVHPTVSETERILDAQTKVKTRIITVFPKDSEPIVTFPGYACNEQEYLDNLFEDMVRAEHTTVQELP